MRHDIFPALALIIAGLALAVFAFGACGGAQRRCHEAVNRTGDMGSRCSEDQR